MSTELPGRMTAAEYRRVVLGEGPKAAVALTPALQPQIRMPAAVKMNHGESEWMRILQARFPAPRFEVRFEPMTFKLPSGCRYTPDLVVMEGAALVELWEVKGKRIHNGHSIRAFKEAAAAWPALRWGFAQRRDGEWTEVCVAKLHSSSGRR